MWITIGNISTSNALATNSYARTLMVFGAHVAGYAVSAGVVVPDRSDVVQIGAPVIVPEAAMSPT
jgi:hypothetical protein